MFENNEMSVESLFARATGLDKSQPEAQLTSTEAYDGCIDAVATAMQSAENAVEFMDVYSMVETKNASDKIRMLKKLNANYGGRSCAGSASIESFCNMQSMEADEAAAAAGGDVAEQKSAPTDTTKKQGKIGKFFGMIFSGIKKFFVKIWEMIKRLIDTIINFFTSKKAKDEEKPAEQKDIDLDKPSEDKEDESKASSGASAGDKTTLLNVDKANNLMLDWTKTPNLGGLGKFVKMYNDYGKQVDKVQLSIMKDAASNASTAAFGKAKTAADIENPNITDGHLAQASSDAMIAHGNDIRGLLDGAKAIANSVPGLVSKSSASEMSAGNVKTVKDAKKYIDGIANSVVFDKQGNRDAACQVVEYLTGIPQLKTGSKNVFETAKRSALSNGLALGKKMKDMIKVMEPTHNHLVQLCTEAEDNIKKNFGNAGNNQASKIGKTAELWGVIASALKLATKCEQVIAKTAGVVSSSAKYQSSNEWDQSKTQK